MKWLREEVAGVCDDDQLIHFCFVDFGTITNVIAYSDPVIEYINSADFNK